MTLEATSLPPETDGVRDRDTAGAVLVALGFGAVFVAVWPLFVMALSGNALDPVALVAHVSGMLAGYGVLIMLVLMSRWPVLERGIGADVLARWHARGGLGGWAGGGAAAGAGKRLRGETWILAPERVVAVACLSPTSSPDGLAGHRWLQLGWALSYTFTFALVLRYGDRWFVRPSGIASGGGSDPGGRRCRVDRHQGRRLSELEASRAFRGSRGGDGAPFVGTVVATAS